MVLRKAHRRGRTWFARDSSVSLTAASSSVEEPKEKSPLIEEMPDRAEESFVPLEKGDVSVS